VAALLKEHPGPWLICANHLTMIDSAILAWAMFPVWKAMFFPGVLPWNLPEKDNFGRSFALHVLCYLLKCVPVRRRGDRRRLQADLQKCLAILGKRESILVFPEGTRSRSGRVDGQNVSYGVGRFLAGIPECRVICEVIAKL
jgi:1-acyl-sn-glycerol-3-phosphate acyltransferase